MSKFDPRDPTPEDTYDEDTRDEQQPLVPSMTSSLKNDLDFLVNRLELLIAVHQHTIAVLSTFYRAELSLSSVQPVLDLAVQLNPSLKE